MKRVLMIAAIVTLTGLFARPMAGQAPQNREEMNATIADLIHDRLIAEQPVRLSADVVTLTGDSLRLSGHAVIRFDDTTIRVAEAAFHRSTSRVELIGKVNAFLGAAARDALRLRPQRPQYK